MLFGTDGVRGLVDVDLNAELAYKIGKGLAIHILKNKLNKKVVIGKDTRISCDTYISAISSALCEYGIDVSIVGVVPTPAVSFFVSRYDYGAGVMITASHNDYKYNGIKVFNEIGEKINKKIEIEIEEHINSDRKSSIQKGQILYDESIVLSYIDNLVSQCNCDLSKLNIVIDSANGANYKIAPYVYRKLGANIIEINCENDGVNINNNCGANHIENVVEEVISHHADFGVAFDGDGDRLCLVTRDGNVLSGDDILLIIAMHLKKNNSLKNLCVAGTIMTNLGMELTLNSQGIKLLRSDVGDKNVIQLMKDNSLSLGGESSGHICLLDYIPSCDALFNSLFFFKASMTYSLDIDKILKLKQNLPSVLKNIKVEKTFRENFNENISIKNRIEELNENYPNSRIVVRPSGTEPVIRIYIESDSEINNEKILQSLLELF